MSSPPPLKTTESFSSSMGKPEQTMIERSPNTLEGIGEFDESVVIAEGEEHVSRLFLSEDHFALVAASPESDPQRLGLTAVLTRSTPTPTTFWVLVHSVVFFLVTTQASPPLATIAP